MMTPNNHPALTVIHVLFLSAFVSNADTATTQGIIDLENSKRPTGAVQLVGDSGHELIPEDPEKPSKWEFKNGVLTASPVWDSPVTKENYGDFRMHLEFNVNENWESTAPEKNGHSGIYIPKRQRGASGWRTERLCSVARL